MTSDRESNNQSVFNPIDTKKNLYLIPLSQLWLRYVRSWLNIDVIFHSILFYYNVK
jgi:hypothetical protein